MTAEHPPPRIPRNRPPQRPGRSRRREPIWAARAGAAGGLAAVIVAGLLILGTFGGGSQRAGAAQKRKATHPASARKQPASARKHSAGTPTPGTVGVPILMYHVIASAPPGASNPNLYVPKGEFTAQMQALKAAGWHAVTLNQLEAYWTRGTPLGPGKPIVLTFDIGYHSQYANALPVLKSLGWVADEDLVVDGLAPSEGGITGSEVHALIAAGWEIDTQGLSHADLIAVGAGQLQSEVASARQQLQQRYGITVNWFSYPFGHYDPGVVAAVKAAGYTGATSTVAGLATKSGDRYTLPRLTVLPGTSPSALLAQIAAARAQASPPASYSGQGLA